MNTLLVNLDFYDDSGTLLRDLVPNASDLPDFVKQAHVMTGKEDRDLYALVLKDQNGFHKKFPTYDVGNTWVSSSYFVENMDKLTKEAQVVAASNLKVACEAFGIPVLEDIEKLASDVDTNFVNIEGKSPERLVKVASSSVYALNGKYPLNNAKQVMQASEYFNSFAPRFTPEERREYAVKVASVAEQYGLPVSDSIEMYAGTTINSDVSEHLKSRQHLLALEPWDTDDAEWTLDELSKVAHTLKPEELAPALAQFDRKNGLDRYWDKDILDPYASLLTKVASGFNPGDEVIQVGPLTVTVSALQKLTQNRRLLVEQFGEEFANEYTNDPVSVFESMPTPQKRIILNLANEQAGR